MIVRNDARFGAESDDPDVAAAEPLLECEPIEELLEAINEPMTVGRFFSNMWHSVSYTPHHPGRPTAGRGPAVPVSLTSATRDGVGPPERRS